MAVDLTTVDTLQTALTYHRKRHTVLTGNVANLDTPGYRPVALERCIAAPATIDFGTSFNDEQRAARQRWQCGLARSRAVEDQRQPGALHDRAERASRRLAVLRYAAGDGT